MKRERKPKEIALRLEGGAVRVPLGVGWPEGVKDGLKAIARKENKSVSWVLEQIVSQYFGFKVHYLPRKGAQVKKEKPHAGRSAKAA